MNAKKWIALAACAAAAVLCMGLWMQSAQRARTPSPAAAQSVRQAQAAPDSASALLPELSSMPITALSVSTPDRSFHFHLDTKGAVSVNGQQADSEIFSTLLDQIAELPVESYTAFKPQSQDLILTLVISSGAKEQTVRFYEDGGKGEKAHIVLGPDEAPEYRQTSGWRVGTLMMTCEGTRIQDANGNETPAAQEHIENAGL